MSTYYGELIRMCDDVLEYSDRFRRAIGLGDMREAYAVSALAGRDLDHIAVSVRRLQEGRVVAVDDVEVLYRSEIGRLHGNVATVSWDEVMATSRIPPTSASHPLFLKVALDKRIHAMVGTYRLDLDAHVILSRGMTSLRRDGSGGVPWIAEWNVARFVEATRGMLVIAERRAPSPSEPRRAA